MTRREKLGAVLIVVIMWLSLGLYSDGLVHPEMRKLYDTVPLGFKILFKPGLVLASVMFPVAWFGGILYLSWRLLIGEPMFDMRSSEKRMQDTLKKHTLFKAIAINGRYVEFETDKTYLEIPYSELAMHCKIAGRTDYVEFLANDRYAYVMFADGRTCEGLISEIVPQFMRDVVGVHAVNKEQEVWWSDAKREFYERAAERAEEHDALARQQTGG